MLGLYKAKTYTTRVLRLQTLTALCAAPCLRLGIQTNPPELARPETQLSTHATVILVNCNQSLNSPDHELQ